MRKTLLTAVVIAALPFAARATETPSLEELFEKIAVAEKICEQWGPKDRFLCEANFTALSIDVFYMDSPKAAAMRKETFGDDANLEEQAHGLTNREEIMREYARMVSAYSK